MPNFNYNKFKGKGSIQEQLCCGLERINLVAAYITSSTHTEHAAPDALSLASTPIAGIWHVAATSTHNDL